MAATCVCIRAQIAPPELIKASEADARIHRYNEPNVVFRPEHPDDVPLVIYMPGTGGKPELVLGLLKVIAGQGYRVIGLEYDDEPAVAQVCPRVLDPACAGEFRQMRIYGTGASAQVSNPPEETIVQRLVALLTTLAARHPDEGWGNYLAAGKPNWSRIVVSGLSQGAGMAAFIAKREEVQRVVLFSSPVDAVGGIGTTALAAWITGPTATPMDRWYAERNSREAFNPGLILSYAALKIPPGHIRVFSLDLPPGAGGSNLYHGTNVKDIRYAPEWRFLYGAAKPPLATAEPPAPTTSRP